MYSGVLVFVEISELKLVFRGQTWKKYFFQIVESLITVLSKATLSICTYPLFKKTVF